MLWSRKFHGFKVQLYFFFIYKLLYFLFLLFTILMGIFQANKYETCEKHSSTKISARNVQRFDKGAERNAAKHFDTI